MSRKYVHSGTQGRFEHQRMRYVTNWGVQIFQIFLHMTSRMAAKLVSVKCNKIYFLQYDYDMIL